ncbi:acyl-CoA dehydrogenase family protein [Paraburkholderia sp. BCC1886]|uniref:acyl-CoA dehydrogenase family protein n=1 Tax=Paraburkholderia sp. BCC1886 TaxID=2562670 RepID=UPI001183050C|nr:acyl-CoA dehydrogenase family protein [Paraburkholderia sp. BCC1886]
MNVTTPILRNYWGTTIDHRSLLAKIAEIGPILDKNADADEAAGELTAASFELLASLRMSHAIVPEALGGAQLSPTRLIELVEAITWHSGAAGWVSMVHAAIGGMSAAFLPDSAIQRLFGPGTDNRFSGQGAPLGMLRKVEGGYRLNGKWSYGSGFSHATYSHSAAFVDDGTGKPLKDEHGTPIIMCAHAPIAEHTCLAGWDVLGLKATGSIDYAAEDVFIESDMVFPIQTAKPLRQKEFFSLGVIGIAAMGHTGWAIGASRRILDEIAQLARSRTGRPGALGDSEKFWYDYSRAEARVRAARALAMETWRDIENTVESGSRVSTRQLSLIHLAKSEVHEAADEAAHFAYRAGGGASLRDGTIQRFFRDIMVALNHITNSPTVATSAGREIGGLWSDRAWQYYDLVEKR